MQARQVGLGADARQLGLDCEVARFGQGPARIDQFDQRGLAGLVGDPGQAVGFDGAGLAFAGSRCPRLGRAELEPRGADVDNDAARRGLLKSS